MPGADMEQDVEGEEADTDVDTKMDHLMHSDTMILVVVLAVMILLGLVFRSLCLRLTSQNSRKELVRSGLRQMAQNMHHVTRAMSNDLEIPNSPRMVIRTYSREAGGVRAQQREKENLRVQALSHSVKQEMGENIEMQQKERNER